MQAAQTLETDPAPRDLDRSAEIAFLLDTVRLITSAVEPTRCFDGLVRAVRRRSPGLCHASLLGWDAHRGLVSVLAFTGGWNGTQPPPSPWRPDGGMALALSSQRPWMTGDRSKEKTRFAPAVPGAQSALCVPVRTEDRVLALLHLESPRPDRFGPADAALFEIVCEHLAGTMLRMALNEEIHRRSDLYARMAVVGREIVRSADLGASLEAGVDGLVASCGCEAARVLVMSEEGELVPRAVRTSRGGPVGGSVEPAWPLRVMLAAGEAVVGALEALPGSASVTHRELVSLMETLGAALALAIDRHRVAERARLASERLRMEVEGAARERRALQNQLLHSERLSSLGELISGVAHELNNPLTGVIGYSQLLAESGDVDRIRRGIEKVHAEARRCHRVVQGLLGFARKHAPEKQYVSVNEILESTLDLRAYQLRVDDITVVRDLSRELPRTIADYHQLQQVFLNLVNNAHHAMQETGKGGTLTVRSVCEEGRIRIEFSDTGTGIPAEHLDRIFEPFYTTKPPGQGTGLGLSICSGIVEDHQGRIRISSSPGKGTVVTVDLPVLRRQETPADPG